MSLLYYEQLWRAGGRRFFRVLLEADLFFAAPVLLSLTVTIGCFC